MSAARTDAFIAADALAGAQRRIREEVRAALDNAASHVAKEVQRVLMEEGIGAVPSIERGTADDTVTILMPDEAEAAEAALARLLWLERQSVLASVAQGVRRVTG